VTHPPVDPATTPAPPMNPAPPSIPTAPGTAAAAPGGDARQRLHPLSPLLRMARTVALIVAGVSWQGYHDLGMARWLAALGAVTVFALGASIVSWLVTGYHVVGRELRVHEGLLWRRTRAIPLERLQSVEVVRPLLARLLGLAELRLEVVGASKVEAPLAYLTVSDAAALRTRLLAIARPSTVVGAVGPAPSTVAYPGGVVPVPRGAFLDAGPESPLYAVSNRDLVIAQLLRPQWWMVPLAVAMPVVFAVAQHDLTAIGLASTFTAMIGAVQAPVRVLLNEWGFRVAVAADGLRLRHGLLETRSQTVPTGRVQAVAVRWPLLWRGLGWVRAHMEVAGLSRVRNDEIRAGSLVPVADIPTAERVIAAAVPGFALRTVVVSAVPARAHWLAPLRAFVLGYQLGPVAFATRDGLLSRRLVIVPYERVQSVRIRQGPLQRLLGLASVHVDTAGAGLGAVAAHRDVREARDLATVLAEYSRSARSTRPHGTHTLAPPPAPQPADAPPSADQAPIA
jgi:putative membrane protein